MDAYVFMNNRSGVAASIQRNSDNACIPFDTANRDCAKFLSDWQAGATVINADSSPATYSGAAVAALGLS